VCWADEAGQRPICNVHRDEIEAGVREPSGVLLGDGCSVWARWCLVGCVFAWAGAVEAVESELEYSAEYECRVRVQSTSAEYECRA
jgi:hypothetical protein